MKLFRQSMSQLVLVSLFLVCTNVAAQTNCNPCDEDDDFDSTAGGTIDVDIRDIYPGNVNPPIALAIVNAAESAYWDSSCTLTALTCTQACSSSFSSSSGQFGPEVGECYFTRQFDGASGALLYGKFQINNRTYNGNNSFYDLTYQTLGSCPCGPPPVANFTFTTYDLIGFFSDTSTAGPTSWSWNFGGTGSSSQQNPNHFFGSAGTRDVTLTATNSSGSDPETKSVTVSEEPSDTITTGSPLDLNGDGTTDLTIINAPSAGCGSNAAFQVINGARWESSGGDYRNIDAGDIPASINGTNPFCIDEGVNGLFAGAFIQTDTSLPSFGTYKLWSPQNSGSAIRVISEALSTTLPDPPVTNWTFTTYDQIAFFEDTSTGNPGAWNWAFGDGDSSSAQNPDHFYSSAATWSVCMNSSNLGGSGTEVCDDVTTETLGQTVIGSIDLDLDGTDDLEMFYPGGCNTRSAFRVVNGARHGMPTGSSDYRQVQSANIPGAIGSTGDFCTEIEVAGLFDTRLVLGSSGKIVKFWTPENTASQTRFEFAELGAACNADYEYRDRSLQSSDELVGCNVLSTGPNVEVTNTSPYVGLFGGQSVAIGNGLAVRDGASLVVGACGHDLCETSSAPLDNTCNPCVQDICTVDPFCCNNIWDSICVTEVETVCQLICQ